MDILFRFIQLNYFCHVVALRVEWCKSKARAARWREEVILVEEEMRRVIAFSHWKAKWWIDQAERRQAVDDALKDGLKAFALEHADSETKFANYLDLQWAAVRSRALSALSGEGSNEADDGALLEIEIDYNEDGDAIGYVIGFLYNVPCIDVIFIAKSYAS